MHKKNLILLLIGVGCLIVAVMRLNGSLNDSSAPNDIAHAGSLNQTDAAPFRNSIQNPALAREDLARDGFNNINAPQLRQRSLAELAQNYNRSVESRGFWAAVIGLRLLESPDKTLEAITWLEKALQLGCTDKDIVEMLAGAYIKADIRERGIDFFLQMGDKDLAALGLAVFGLDEGNAWVAESHPARRRSDDLL
jgi:hypothetical protein